MKRVGIAVLGFFCLALLVGVVGAGPAVANSAIESDGSGIQGNSLSVLQPQDLSDCNTGYVCFWSGKTFGQAECESGLNCFSEFSGTEVGCHGLENINPQSMLNHTINKVVEFFNGGLIEPLSHIYANETFQWGSPYTQDMCIRET
jgi:hypothetical protein